MARSVAALALSLAALPSRASGPAPEACPLGSAGAGCAAAAAAAASAGEADGAVDLVQVLAARRTADASLSAPARRKIWHDWARSGYNYTPAASVDEAYSGIWLCQWSNWTGPRFINASGGRVAVHSSCGPIQARWSGDSVLLIENDWPAILCWIADGGLRCSNGDSCSKSYWDIEYLRAPFDYKRYLGHWLSKENKSDAGIDISLAGSELFLKRASGNLTGYIHYTQGSYMQADLCQNGLLVTSTGVRVLQVGLPDGELRASWLLPGALDWSESIAYSHPTHRTSFPYLAVGLPCGFCLLGFPVLCFLGTVPRKDRESSRAARRGFHRGYDIAYEEAAAGDWQAFASSAEEASSRG